MTIRREKSAVFCNRLKSLPGVVFTMFADYHFYFKKFCWNKKAAKFVAA
jgi:hypothetical protein